MNMSEDPVNDEAPGDDAQRGHDDQVRSEASVLAAFVVGTLGAFGFVGGYLAGSNQTWLGLSLAVALAGLGYGLVAWGHGLMPAGGETEDRHPIAPPIAEEQEAAHSLQQRGLRIGRRKVLGTALITALGATGLAALMPALSLGRRPGDALRHTAWGAGGNQRLVTIEGLPVAAGQLDVGGVLTVFPEGHPGDADAQTLLIKLGTDVAVRSPAKADWMADGHIAYSKVCTHAGCPVGLYQATQQLLFCPCHQSSFDVVEGARPLMGPANRGLPQLPLAVDDQGFLVATGDFPEAVGPGWWTRP